MLETTSIIFGVISTLSSIIFAYLAFKRNYTNDNNQRIAKSNKNEGRLISDISYIKSSLDRLDLKIDKVEQNYLDLLSRIIKLEKT